MSNLPRFYVNPGRTPTNLSAEESTHALKALRLKKGDQIICFDGHGTEYLGFIQEMKPLVRFNIVKKTIIEPSVSKLTLIISLFKLDRLEYALEKCTELGVDSIIFTKTQFSQLELNLAQKKVERFKNILISACKQSERAWLPTFETVSLNDLLRKIDPNSLNLIGVTKQDTVLPLKEVLAESKSLSITLFIGPEGGFAPKELKTILAHNLIPVSFSQHILRSETAAIAGTGLLKHYLDF